MDDQAPKPVPKRRGLRSTLWVAIAVVIGGIVVFCIQRVVVGNRAQGECDRTFAAWESGRATPADACQASRNRLLAEMAVPFADRDKAATSHLDRVERVRLITYGPVFDWLTAENEDAPLDDAKTGQAEVDRYYQGAKQIAAEECQRIWIGTIVNEFYDHVHQELRAASIADYWQGNLGFDDIIVAPADIPRAREILLSIRQQHPDVFWIRGVDPPMDIHLKYVGKESQQRKLLDEMRSLPDFYEYSEDYRVDPYIRVAANLQTLARPAAIETLTTFAREKAGNRVFVLCRMLFVKKPGAEFRRPAIGGHQSAGERHADWPLEPITLVDGVPFLVYWDWALGGEPESPESYLAYCLKECDWNPGRFKCKSLKEKQQALVKLLESKNWASPMRDEVKQALTSQIQ